MTTGRRTLVEAFRLVVDALDTAGLPYAFIGARPLPAVTTLAGSPLT